MVPIMISREQLQLEKFIRWMVLRWQNVRLAASWDTWTFYIKEGRRLRQVCIKFLMRLRNQILPIAIDTWKENAAFQRKIRIMSSSIVIPKRSSNTWVQEKWILFDRTRKERDEWKTLLDRPFPSRKPRNREHDLAALVGDMDHIGKDNYKRMIRCFVSSTFDDTFHERNFLLEDVVPYLKECARNRGLDFAFSEMRFGIRDKASSENRTSEICMEELRYCQDVSPGMNYILISGDKYGFRPCPPRISKEHFEGLLQCMPSDGASLVTASYSQDKNVHEAPEFILRSVEEISGLQPGAHDAVHRHLLEAAKLLWPDGLKELRDPRRSEVLILCLRFNHAMPSFLIFACIYCAVLLRGGVCSADHRRPPRAAAIQSRRTSSPSRRRRRAGGSSGHRATLSRVVSMSSAAPSPACTRWTRPRPASGGTWTSTLAAE